MLSSVGRRRRRFLFFFPVRRFFGGHSVKNDGWVKRARDKATYDTWSYPQARNNCQLTRKKISRDTLNIETDIRQTRVTYYVTHYRNDKFAQCCALLMT